MSSESVPVPESDANLRLSNSDRERVVAHLNHAVSEGRLTIDEFTARLDGVLAAKTFGEITPFVRDLPRLPSLPNADDQATFRARGSNIIRTGRWTVPSRIRIEARGARVRLDFTEAVVISPMINLSVDVHGCFVRLIVPRGYSVDFGSIAMHGGTAKNRGVPAEPTPGVHIAVSGESHGSSIRATLPSARRWPWSRSQRELAK